jgi:HD-GYP domain-containing protein (c-di-GMP phosphodiesterase class II)
MQKRVWFPDRQLYPLGWIRQSINWVFHRLILKSAPSATPATGFLAKYADYLPFFTSSICRSDAGKKSFMALFSLQRSVKIKMSEVMSALSYALDLVEGQPEGHSVRSCLIGMRLARDLGMDSFRRSALFYALLMKDLGCSSNAAKMCYLFGADDMATKGRVKSVNWRSFVESMRFAAINVAPGKPLVVKAMRLLGIAATSQRAGRELVQIRCDRGAKIARKFGLSEETAVAIHSLDEHFDGGGYPDGLIGDEIPIIARIMGLAQTAEVFLRQSGLEAMRDMARQRRGTWFDPELVNALLAIDERDELWRQLKDNAAEHLAAIEPEDRVLVVDDKRLDEIAAGFAEVIDAKSPWTFRHSKGVAEVACGIGQVLGFAGARLRNLNRAALLHDVGKLGISNLILDKPGKLTPEELIEMRKHPGYTQSILLKVAGFRDLAELAASHHERLDGKGYHRGLDESQLSQDVRILCVSDMYEALAAKRPYRSDLTGEQVMDILKKNSPLGICPEVLAALVSFLDKSQFKPHELAA